MTRRNKPLVLFIAAVAVSISASAITVIATLVFVTKPPPAPARDNVVGVWWVNAPDAPFARHMFTFHPDGTMQQSNPDAGDEVTSDSDGHGIWRRDGDTVEGVFGEVTASRTDHKPVTRGEITFSLQLHGADTFEGSAVARFFDFDGNPLRWTPPTALHATRLVIRPATPQVAGTLPR